jgi:hypothetical protein
LADEKRRVEELLESSNTKFRRLNERVGKLENDVIFLLSVDASGDCENWKITRALTIVYEPIENKQ